MKTVLRLAKRLSIFLLALFSAFPSAAEDALSQLAEDALKIHPTISLSPSGKYVAVKSRDGEVTVFDTATGGKKLLPRQTDPPGDLAWSPDDRFLFVSQGATLATYDAARAKWHSTLKGDMPLAFVAVSPNGRYLSAIRGHNLWVARIDIRTWKPLTTSGNAELLAAEPDPLFASEFDVDRHYWWSPDSSSIAFVETEFPATDHYILPGGKLPVFRLRVVDVNSRQVRTITESDDQWPYLLRAVWHPDSRRVAFYRLNRLQNSAELCLSNDSGLQTVLTEKDAYWINAPVTPLFVDSGKSVVVSSERTGQRHLYLYGVDGTLVRDLTPSDLEVYHLSPTVDARHSIYVSGVSGDKQELHLFRIPLKGGEAIKLTAEPGWHEVSLNAAGTAYLDRYSSAVKPPSIWFLAGDTQPRELVGPSAAQQPCATELLTIKTHDNIILPARLFKPDNFETHKRYPVILYTFSGPRGRVVTDSWDGWQMAWNRFMVSKGYLVVAVDVRGSGGYGHLFEEYIHYRFGAQETVDLREVLSFLKLQPYVDPLRFGIWGCDYGAHTVVHAMLEYPHGFKAGFADSPITDWSQYDAYFTERYLGLPARRKTEYEDSSALEHAARTTGDLLAAFSPDNPIIRADHMEALQKAMKEAKHGAVANRLHVVNIPHPAYRDNPTALAMLLSAMSEFFEHTL